MVESTVSQLDLVFHALADRTRRAILENLSKGHKTVSELAQPFKMSLAAVSKHLKVLERANLIHREKQGSYYIMNLNAEGLKSAEQWLADYQQFWDLHLQSLKHHLENLHEDKV